MKYSDVSEGIFLARPNRFIAHVELNGKKEICHVKNTGRCRELLIPGVSVFVEKAQNPKRKTKYDLIAVKKGENLINIDSQAPNKAVAEWLEQGNLCSHKAHIMAEKTFGSSRIDFYVEDGEEKLCIEVKGVTLEGEGIARFPDAPTERGVKHVKELIELRREGYRTFIIFVIQMKGIRSFEPNRKMQPEFAKVLSDAAQSGVGVLAYDCFVTGGSMTIDKKIEVRLEG